MTRCTNPHNDTMDPDGHCWHFLHTLYAVPPVQVLTCCHCGTEKHNIYRPPPVSHGPYVTFESF